MMGASLVDLTDYAALLGFGRNPPKGEQMSDYRDTEELSGWDVAYSAAYAEEQEKEGYSAFRLKRYRPKWTRKFIRL
jgi:hypothetical protein